MTDSTQPTNLSKRMRRRADQLLALSAVALLAVGTIAYQLFEDWSWVDALYFCVVAVTTVGFGDLSPTSDGAKLFTVFYILSGVTIVSVWLNERLRHHTKNVAKRYGDPPS